MMKRREFLTMMAAGAVTSCGRSRFVLAGDGMSDGPKPLVIYHHGSSETAQAIKTDAKNGIIAALKANGYLVAASDAHGNNWGNQTSIDDYVALYNFLPSSCISNKVLFLCQSMGGLSSLLSLVDGRIPNVKGWYGIYPCTNLANNYAQPSLTGGINSAYGISGGNPYATATAGHDPNLISASSFPNIRYRASASYGDTLVPRADNWDLMATILSGKLEASTLDATGNHGNISHFNASDVISFFNMC